MAFSVSLEAIDIKWKEKYDAVVVGCHHCGDRMKTSLRKILFIFFCRETPTSP